MKYRYSKEQAIKLRKTNKIFIILLSILFAIVVAVFVGSVFLIDDQTALLFKIVLSILLFAYIAFLIYALAFVIVPANRRIVHIERLLVFKKLNYEARVNRIDPLTTIKKGIKGHVVEIDASGDVFSIYYEQLEDEEIELKEEQKIKLVVSDNFVFGVEAYE